MPATITATSEASAALSRLRQHHGDIILHITGGWCSRTPMALAKGDLCLGVRDVLLGEVAGVPIYKMTTSPGEHIDTSRRYVLELVDGLAIGFSIEPAPGKHFLLNDDAA